MYGDSHPSKYTYLLVVARLVLDVLTSDLFLTGTVEIGGHTKSMCLHIVCD